MECGKLTAKLRDAVPVCFMVDGKESKPPAKLVVCTTPSR